MAPLKSTRVAWSIAIASLALWATSAPLSWGQVTTSAVRLFDQSMDETTSTTTSMQIVMNDTTTPPADDAGAFSAPCPAVTPPLTQPAPPAVTPPVGSAQEGTFRLCGADAQVARSIEQLLGGRGFSATLSAQGDGCADLTVRATSPAAAGGRASSNLKVSLGSGQTLSIQIVSEGGATHVTIGQDR